MNINGYFNGYICCVAYRKKDGTWFCYTPQFEDEETVADINGAIDWLFIVGKAEELRITNKSQEALCNCCCNGSYGSYGSSRRE